MVNIFEMLGAAFFLVLGLMSILWVVYYFKKNVGIIDIGWSLSFVLVVWAYFLLGDGYAPKKWVMALMVTIWGCRLAWSMYQRYVVAEEDSRYKQLLKNWGDEDFTFFMLFIFLGVLVVVLSLPFIIVSAAAESRWQGVEVLGMIFWLAGVAGEATADMQLFRFKQSPDNRDKVCQQGLWYFSRHPNYFFEFIVWLGYFFFALGTSGGWLAIISPALILLLLMKVTGIPLVEEQALKSKGAAYEEYQKTTSSFIPWFRK